MKAKPEKRLLAERLRLEQGLSYGEISERIGVSKSTLSNWLKQIHLAPEQEERIRERMESNQSVFVAYARQINKERFAQFIQDVAIDRDRDRFARLAWIES